MFANREQAARIEYLLKEMANRDKLVAEFQAKLAHQVNEISTLEQENKRILADKASLKNRIEELLPLETLNLDREKMQPRLDNLTY